jgi:hypothetical protein
VLAVVLVSYFPQVQYLKLDQISQEKESVYFRAVTPDSFAAAIKYGEAANTAAGSGNLLSISAAVSLSRRARRETKP